MARSNARAAMVKRMRELLLIEDGCQQLQALVRRLLEITP